MDDEAQSVLAAEGLSLKRGRKRIYDKLSVTFGPGITALLGPNGAGKTTLIEGLLLPRRAPEGSVQLDGHAVPDELSERDYLARVGHMPQSWRFFSGFTVEESVRYVAWLKRVDGRETNSAVESALAATDLIRERRTKIRKLSGGMRQRVGLAEAFVNNPRLLLLDEPTVGLDPAQRAAFRQFVRTGSKGRAVILSTHLTDDVESIADRVIVVAGGRIKFDGSPAALKDLGDGIAGASRLEAGYLAAIGSEARGVG